MTSDQADPNVVISLERQGLTGECPDLVHGADLGPGYALTVEAWVDARQEGCERMQALVSQWTPPDDFPGFSAFDATDLYGLKTRGYFGAVFDGRYVYF
ncbi:uncharacterized protein METZ01_LOCUS509311, partial [marine metagenome]